MSAPKSLAMTLIRQNPARFKGLPYPLRADAEVAMLAVSLRGNLLQYAGHWLLDSADIVTEAISNDIGAIRYASPRLRANPSIIQHCVSLGGGIAVVRYCDKEILKKMYGECIYTDSCFSPLPVWKV